MDWSNCWTLPWVLRRHLASVRIEFQCCSKRIACHFLVQCSPHILHPDSSGRPVCGDDGQEASQLWRSAPRFWHVLENRWFPLWDSFVEFPKKSCQGLDWSYFLYFRSYIGNEVILVEAARWLQSVALLWSEIIRCLNGWLSAYFDNCVGMLLISLNHFVSNHQFRTVNTHDMNYQKKIIR